MFSPVSHHSVSVPYTLVITVFRVRCSKLIRCCSGVYTVVSKNINNITVTIVAGEKWVSVQKQKQVLCLKRSVVVCLICVPYTSDSTGMIWHIKQHALTKSMLYFANTFTSQVFSVALVIWQRTPQSACCWNTGGTLARISCLITRSSFPTQVILILMPW